MSYVDRTQRAAFHLQCSSMSVRAEFGSPKMRTRVGVEWEMRHFWTSSSCTRTEFSCRCKNRRGYYHGPELSVSLRRARFAQSIAHQPSRRSPSSCRRTNSAMNYSAFFESSRYSLSALRHPIKPMIVCVPVNAHFTHVASSFVSLWTRKLILLDGSDSTSNF